MIKNITSICLLSLLTIACAGSPREVRTSQVILEAPVGSVEPEIRVKIGGRRGGLKKFPLETYLAGVIGNEMSRKWPLEALKAQTVAARSYALYRMNQAKRDGRRFDVVPTQADQVFRAKDITNEYLKGIVDQTRGLVLWNGGEVVQAFYSSTCGGKTRTAESAGLSNTSPLNKACADDYCLRSPFRNWAMSVSRADLEKRFKKHGQPYNGLRSIEVVDKDASGYVKKVEIVDAKGVHTITGERFRKLMGNMSLKSLLFSVSKDGNAIYFDGHGFGHGVGLCQFGAKQMAVKGKGYRSILNKFYPGISLQKAY